MEWYFVVLLVVGVVLLLFFAAGFFLFRFLCEPDRQKSASLDGNASRSLQAYVPVIKQKALQNNAFPHEMVFIKAFDDVGLRAKLFLNERADRFVILVHGYHSCASWDFGASFAHYYNAGYSVLVLDNRGHGSGGSYIGFGALDQRDVHSWMQYLVQRFGESIKIALAGVSMGAATVLLVSGNHPIPQLCAVIEDCGYCSLRELFYYLIRQKKVPPTLLVAFASIWSKLLAGYFFSEATPENAVKKSRVPTLFIHGTADTFVPFYMQERLYKACAAPKARASFRDSIHGESSYREPERYGKVVTSFLREYMA